MVLETLLRSRRPAKQGAPARRGRRRHGQSLVEFALVLPVFLLLFATTLDLGRLAFARVSVTNAAREGAFQAADTPTGYQAGQPCDSDPTSPTYNIVFCRIQLEAQNSGVSISPSDVTVTCSPSCTTGLGNTVKVSIVGHFQLLTPLLAAFFGGSQSVTFTASSTNQIETLPTPPPAATATPTPTPTPTPSPSGSASPSPTASPTSPSCQLPSAGFDITSPTLPNNNLHAPLTVQVVDRSTSQNCGIDSWLWTWGDGLTNVGQVPPGGGHTYTTKGDFVITLRVQNAAGSNTVGGQTIHIKP